MKAMVALLMIAVSAAAWQTPAKRRKAKPAADTTDYATFSFPVVKLVVEGSQQVPSEAILRTAGIKVGDKASKEAFDAARQKLMDSGFFESVGYEYKPVPGDHPGYSAKFIVSEVKPLYKIEFAGLPAKDEELNAYLKSRDPLYIGFAPPTQPIITRWASYLSAWTASKNQPKKVIGKLVQSAGNSFIVRFQPDEALPAVARVEFTGNETIDTKKLQNEIGAVAYGLPYTEGNFLELLDNQLRPLYEAKGYMKVRFEDVSTEPVPPPVKGLLVKVKIVEGDIYKLGKVRVTGAVDDDERDSLLHAGSLKQGETANFDAVKEALEKIRKAVKRSGYYRSEADMSKSIDEKAKKVDVTFHVEHGARYSFGDLTIKGLDIEGENAVRKQWSKKPGDAFNAEYPDYFLAQVKDEGIFDYLGGTHSEVKVDDTTHRAEVTLVFASAPKKPEQEKKKGGFGPY